MAPVGDDGAVCDVVLAAHVPLLRIDADSVPFAGGDLWRMPFEAFDQLTMGAFEDHRAKYEAVAPVFYREMVRPRLDNLEPLPESNGRSARLQLKWSNDEWPALSQIGLDLVHRFHMLAADAAWLALLLEAPAAAFPQPRWSVTFVVADEGWGFVLPDHHCRIVSVQGDADMEYLMAPAFAGAPLPAPVLARASARADALRRDGPHPALG